MKNILIAILMVAAFQGLSLSSFAGDKMGFWTFGGNKDWGSGKGSDMDNALVVFIQMKEKYGDQFQLIIEDLKEKGATRADELKHQKSI